MNNKIYKYILRTQILNMLDEILDETNQNISGYTCSHPHGEGPIRIGKIIKRSSLVYEFRQWYANNQSTMVRVINSELLIKPSEISKILFNKVKLLYNVENVK